MHFNKFLIFLKIFLINSAVVVESYKYLFIFPSSTKSHFVVGSALMQALAERGHEVHVISAFPQEKPIKNYYDISLKSKSLEDPFKTPGSWMKKYLYYPHEPAISETVLQHAKVQKLIVSNSTFDAVICDLYMSEALFGFSEHFKAPLILLASTATTAWNTDLIGSPAPPSYMALSLASTDISLMSFKERLINTLYITAVKLDIYFDHLPKQAALYSKYFPHLKRDLYAVRKNVAAVLLNTHAPVGQPRPQPPSNHIEVGGMHIKGQRELLPEDIKNFIEDAEHGVVYFSLGSSSESSFLTYEKYMELLTVFENLKQRVLWKMNEFNLKGKHDNVYVSSWLPQQDILAHENVKLFVTHGGWLGVMESIYHAKPIIGIPVNEDQFVNVATVEKQGIGIGLDMETLKAQDLIRAVQHVLTNGSYARRVSRMSARYRDQAMPPLDLAVYWAEHVARHKDGNYMCCADLDINFMPHKNMDAILALYGGTLFAVYAVIYLAKKLLKAVWRKMLPRRIRKKFKISSLWQVPYGAWWNKMLGERVKAPVQVRQSVRQPVRQPVREAVRESVPERVPAAAQSKTAKENKARKAEANAKKNKKNN